MPERIARSLLMHVFYRVSVIVAVSKDRRAYSVKAFDTAFGAEFMVVPRWAEEIWLISNHPEGQCTLYAEDVENLRRIESAARDARMRMFIANEDTGCREIDLVQAIEL